MPTVWTRLEATCASAMMDILAMEQPAVSLSYNLLISGTSAYFGINLIRARTFYHAFTKRHKFPNTYYSYTKTLSWLLLMPCSHTIFTMLSLYLLGSKNTHFNVNLTSYITWSLPLYSVECCGITVPLYFFILQHVKMETSSWWMVPLQWRAELRSASATPMAQSVMIAGISWMQGLCVECLDSQQKVWEFSCNTTCRAVYLSHLVCNG